MLLSKHTSKQQTTFWKIVWSFLALGLVGIIPGGQIARATIPDAVTPNPWPGASALESILDSSTLFIPIVRNEGEENTDPRPIWSHRDVPALHEVNLFRKTFTIEESLEQADLQIFADTRYQVWVDGIWLGQGPARFSKFTREYDIYPLGDLSPGQHLVAILVQWAPNNRRSESTTPYLLAHIKGFTSGRHTVKAATGPFWKVMPSSAWRQDAALVHTWGLIGPTELLDLRQLPPDWMTLGYSDSGWSQAIVKDISVVEYQLPQVPRLDPLVTLTDPVPLLGPSPTRIDLSTVNFLPRSLPFLERVNIPIQVLDAGFVSPGKWISEIEGPAAERSIRVVALDETTITFETVTIDGPPDSDAFRLDGRTLDWVAVGEERPDVYAASENIRQGEHSFKVYNIPQKGLTISVSVDEIWTKEFPFLQGAHAGRRSLLAELVSSAEAVSVQSNDGLDISFGSLPSYVVLDLGRTVYGRLAAQVNGPSGTIVDIGWDERLFNGGSRPIPYPGSLHPQWNQVDSWILDGNRRQLSTIDSRAGRYILIMAWGDAPIELNDVQVFEERLPLDQIGWFESTDPLLNRIWQLGVDTLYSNMNDAYADPWRERGQWWGDAYVIDHANRVAFGDNVLLRRGLRYMAQAITGGRPDAMAPNGDGNHMLDYGMLWVQSLRDYVQRTGDVQILEETYSPLVDLMNYLARYEDPSTGMLDIPKGPWHKTTYIDTIGVLSRYGQSAAVNAMYYRTLFDAANLAEKKVDIAHAVAWKQKATTLKEEIHVDLFMPAKHIYLSSLLDGDMISPSPHAQAWPLALGIVPTQEVDHVVDALLGLLTYQPDAPEIEVYGTFWLLEALGQAGYIEAGLNIIKTYYGSMLDSDASTTWEIYNADQHFNQSLSHGWGSSPTWFLSTYLLGAHQLGPNSWEVIPAYAGVERASGAIPLANGLLEVAWDRSDCAVRMLSIKSPQDSQGTIRLNDSKETKRIELNGELVWEEGAPLSAIVTMDQDSLLLSIPGGTQSVEVIQNCTAVTTP